MRTKRTYVLMAVAASLVLLWIAGSARAYPPADEPPFPAPLQAGAGASVAGVTTPLLQYQGRLTDPSTGEPVADDVYSMSFRLYDVESGGSWLWTETKEVPVQGGLFSTALGDTTLLDQGLFNGQALWLGITVGADAEAMPRQQILPVAYALSLVPGAQVTGESDGQPALRLEHTGDGNALLGVISSTNPDRMAIMGVNNGPGCGVGGFTNSDVSAGVGGYNAGMGPGVSGHSPNGYGGYFTSTNSSGVYGYSVNFSGVQGEAEGGWAGVSGNNLGSGPGGYFSSVSGPALYADGAVEVAGDLTVSGSLIGGSHDHDDLYYTEGESDGRFVNVTGDTMSGALAVPQVTYTTPRTHYFIVGSAGFFPRSNVDYQNAIGDGGAYIVSGSGALVAPVHLPQGAVVTEFEVFFYDNSSSDMDVYLELEGLSGGYAYMAQVSSSGTPGYYSVTDTSISAATINNTTYSYLVFAFSSAWDSNLRIKGALITYTINEAP